MIKWFLIFLLTPLVLKAQVISDLKIEGQSATGAFVDTYEPVFSWKIISDEKGERQTAYQIMVVSEDVKNSWVSTTKQIQSSNSTAIKVSKIPLRYNQDYYWKVRIWNKAGKPTAWSDKFYFHTALMSKFDWKADWISASKWFTPIEYRPKGLELSAKGGWADVDLAQDFQIDSIKIYPAESESFPARFSVEIADNLFFKDAKAIINYQLPKSKQAKNVVYFPIKNIHARYVRLRIDADTLRKSDFSVRQLEIYSGGKNIALKKFTREYGTKWSRGHAPFLVDGKPDDLQGKECPEDACPTTSAPIFRKQFVIEKKIKKATLYYASLGMSDVFINGKKLGKQVLSPRFSDYTKRIYYIAKDVTTDLQMGENVFGVMLANGFYNPPGRGFGKRHGGNGAPQLILQTEIEFTDGTKKSILSDDSWKWSKSEVVFNDLWLGYTEDRQQEQEGWKTTKFKDNSWIKARMIESPKDKLVAFTGKGIEVLDTIKPLRIHNDTVVFKNQIAGWPQLRVNGKQGQVITISGILEGIKLPVLTFKLAKNGETILQPNFLIFAGTNQLKIEGLTSPLKLTDISVLQVGAQLNAVSAFTCSNPYLNKLYDVTKRTLTGYLYDFPADPTREKQGWTQDAQNMFNATAYLFDVETYYKNWWRDMADNQDEQGYIGSVVPVVNRQVYDWNSPWWSGASVFLPAEYNRYYGDSTFLKASYHTIKRYVDFLERMTNSGEGKIWDAYPYFNGYNTDTAAAKEKLLIWNGAGDWQNPYTKGQFAVPAPMSSMPAFYKYTKIVAETANLFGNFADAEHYENLALQIQKRFNDYYLDTKTGIYGKEVGNQTAQVLPLAVGMVPENLKAKVYQQLLNTIRKRDGHIGTGFVATSFLLQLLARNQESELANEMINKQDYPGWNTLIEEGFLKENWKGEGVQMPSCGGAIAGWLIESVLGIQPDSSSAGFQRFIVAPQPDVKTGLTSAKGYYDTKYGRISSNWQLKDDSFEFKVTVPVNSTAMVYIPTSALVNLFEGGEQVLKAKEIKVLRFGKGKAVLGLPSGSYSFISKNLSL